MLVTTPPRLDKYDDRFPPQHEPNRPLRQQPGPYNSSANQTAAPLLRLDYSSPFNPFSSTGHLWYIGLRSEVNASQTSVRLTFSKAMTPTFTPPALSGGHPSIEVCLTSTTAPSKAIFYVVEPNSDIVRGRKPQVDVAKPGKTLSCDALDQLNRNGLYSMMLGDTRTNVMCKNQEDPIYPCGNSIVFYGLESRSIPCQHDGLCIQEIPTLEEVHQGVESNFTCECTANFTGPICRTPIEIMDLNRSGFAREVDEEHGDWTYLEDGDWSYLAVSINQDTSVHYRFALSVSEAY